MSDTYAQRRVRQMSDQELRLFQDAIVQEQALRRRLDASPEKIEHAIAEYQKATGKGQGEPWEQPVTALQAYRAGAEVEHEGQWWVSTHSSNVHAPGVSGWRIKPEVDDDGNDIPPPYVAPSGAHDSYQQGERITFDGQVYEAVRDGVAHSPEEYAADWRLVEEEPEPEPELPEDEDDGEPGDDDQDEGGEDEDDEPVDPDEPGEDDSGEDDQDDGEADEEPALPVWAPDQDYAAGDEMTYDGAQYRVLQPHRSAAHWLPSAVPALYERL